MKYEIRAAVESDTTAVLALNRIAFGSDEGPVIAELVHNLLADPTARPLLSLVGTIDDTLVGHVLFTKAEISGSDPAVAASILAPLCAHPDHQGVGIGAALIREGLSRLAAEGVALVFVLGYPDYYSRHGFAPAGAQGLYAPYPIAPKNAEAWMVQELQPGVIGRAEGHLSCADALDHAKYWQE